MRTSRKLLFGIYLGWGNGFENPSIRKRISLKVLFLSHAQYITVGLPKIIELAEHMVSKGHDVTLVATSKTKRFTLEVKKVKGVNYVLSPSVLWGKWRHGADMWDVFRRTLFFIGRHDFDIIHAIDSRPTVILPAIALSKAYHIPLVVEWSDLYSGGGTISERSSKLYQITLGKVESFFELFFRKYADGATAITSHLRKRLLELGFDERRILLHRMGCIIDDSKITTKEIARRKLGLDISKTYIGHLGRIYPSDHELLLRAFGLLSHGRQDLELLLVGGIDDRLRLPQSQVKYVGYVDEDRYNEYCNAVDFFVLPLKQSVTNVARWPSKIGDYLSFGKPVVSTKVSDFEEIFGGPEIGILSPTDGVDDFTIAMETMIRERKQWEQWGKNGLAYSKQNLDWNIITSKLIDFYMDTIGRAQRN